MYLLPEEINWQWKAVSVEVACYYWIARRYLAPHQTQPYPDEAFQSPTNPSSLSLGRGRED
jgi:hypothetical protein